ncbi:MAG TPA: hypothetical protein VFR56_06605 [Actinomycetes bacterium]|nr:hypothetical protein [Actinomycetes bacterium]
MTRRTPRGSSGTSKAVRWRWLPRLHWLDRRPACEQCGRTGAATYCEVCGYELVRRTRDAAPKVPNV